MECHLKLRIYMYTIKEVFLNTHLGFKDFAHLKIAGFLIKVQFSIIRAISDFANSLHRLLK